jgi:hypothetical protein
VENHLISVLSLIVVKNSFDYQNTKKWKFSDIEKQVTRAAQRQKKELGTKD